MTRLALVLATLIASLALVLGVASPASAHVLPTTAVVLDVHEQQIDATLRIPLDDLETASGIDLGSSPASRLRAETARLRAYLVEHVRPVSADGTWTVTAGALSLSTSEQLGTGQYPVLIAHLTLVPPTTADERAFTLHYDVVLNKVITHVAIVSVRSDWSSGRASSAREIGTVQLDTVTGEVPALRVDLGAGSAWRGFGSMVALGVTHIVEGTDHQLFLLTLLLPAPLLLAGRRRWGVAVTPKRAVRRITAITLAFTVGHSITLALGATGVLPVPQQLVEAMIAVSILVAAAHAIRPIFPGREPLVAAAFGLIHGMAFSATLASLDLSGGELVLSLLGFNLGIELMQLAVVALVLPPLIVLARGEAYGRLRTVAAVLTAIAAAGWLAARLGAANPIAAVADRLAPLSPWIVVALWATASASMIRAKRGDSNARPNHVDGVPAVESVD